MYEGRRLLMVKRRKKRNKSKPKLTYSYFVNKRLKDLKNIDHLIDRCLNY